MKENEPKIKLRLHTHNMFVNLGPGLARELTTWVAVGKAFDINKVSEIPKPVSKDLLAVWDTGAMATAISRKLAMDLQLEKIGERLSYGATGCEVCNRFLVSLYIPGDIVIPELEVGDCGGDIGCDVLIGMDVISQGDFAVNNYLGHTSFTFRVPSVERMDFTTQLPRTAIDGKFKTKQKIGRNEPCPCGSGKKYKKCHGR